MIRLSGTKNKRPFLVLGLTATDVREMQSGEAPRLTVLDAFCAGEGDVVLIYGRTLQEAYAKIRDEGFME